MPKKLLISFLLFFLFTGVHGQFTAPPKIDSLLNLLRLSTSDTTRINLLLTLADAQIKKSGELRTDLDSAANYIDKANQINSHLRSRKVEGRILILKARLYREGGQRPAGKILAEKAVTILNNEKDNFLSAQAYLENAEYYSVDGSRSDFDQKVKLVERGVNCLRTTGKTADHIQLKAASLQFLADLYTTSDEHVKALKLLQESLADYRSIHYPLVQGIYELIARAYYSLKNFPEAIKYALKALQTSEQVRDMSMQRCVIYNTLGIIYVDMGETEKAITYFKGALRIAEINNDYNNVVLLFFNIGNSYFKVNKPQEALAFANSVSRKYLKPRGDRYDFMVPATYLSIYNQLKQLREAQHYCKQLLQLLGSKKYDFDLREQLNMYAAIIIYYIESKNFAAAAAYLKIDRVLAMKLKDPMRISTHYRACYRLDTAMHDFKAANRYFLKFYEIRDSIFTAAKIRQIQQFQVQFETEKKENELKIKDQRIRYLSESAKLQKAVLNKTTLIKNITIVAILFLFVITGLLYKQFKNKQKINKVILQTNETITEQNKKLGFLVEEKEWLLKEVHHRVKNNLHTIICLLESQAAYLENDALKAIEKSQNRIYTMSLIHQKLYQSEDIQTIDMAGYIPELVQYIRDGFDISDQIYCLLDIDQVSLDPGVAIPVALIINEALTNSIKYAFPGNRRGEINISLKDQEETVTLELSDNGIGMHKSKENLAPVSLGLQLINGLAREIRGELFIESVNGFRIVVVFKKQPLDYSEISDHGMVALN